ncbi:MAG TPA: LptE family protein [Bacteroidales bacterium]|nr:LptE family protein [Bacteroidales bacterium]
MKKTIFIVTLVLLVSSCTMSYKFNGASIDYDLTKTMMISDFPNQAPLVYPPLEQRFNEELKDLFTRSTRLQFVNQNGDMEMEGEIVGYELTPLAVQEDSFASETRLTLTVRMRFRNNKAQGQDKEETIKAYRNFPADKMIDEVQDQLIAELVKEITDQIFNTTMSNW